MFLSDHSTSQFKHITNKTIDIYSTIKRMTKGIWIFLIKFMAASIIIYRQEKGKGN